METFSALLAICAGNSPVTGEFPAQRPVTRSFDVFFDLRLNKQLGKRRGWGFVRQSRLLWRHCNAGQTYHFADGISAYKQKGISRDSAVMTRWRRNVYQYNSAAMVFHEELTRTIKWLNFIRARRYTGYIVCLWEGLFAYTQLWNLNAILKWISSPDIFNPFSIHGVVL